jgi:UV DNA damage repair endonuclease
VRYSHKSSDINDYEIYIITELITQEDIHEPTYEEINTALSVMKKGKAADVFELTVENILYGEDELLYIIHKMIEYRR